MNNLKNAKQNYDEIPIPEELSKRVQEAIEISEVRHKKMIKMHRRKVFGRSVGAAAAITLTFTAMLNTNTAFAESVSKIPVIKEVSRVLTFKVYDEAINENPETGALTLTVDDEEIQAAPETAETPDPNISIEVPDIEMIESETNGLAASINQEIHDRCQQYADEAVKDAEEYKKAFLATGGTEEEWIKHNIQIQVWYDVKSQTNDYLSYIVGGSESWNPAHNETKYYNIDLKTEKLVTLEDLFGEDYIQIINDSIKSQMKTKKLDHDMPYFTPEQGGFTTITDETKFYMNEAGNPVIVFGKYEIAPGAAGEIEFEIPVNK